MSVQEAADEAKVCHSIYKYVCKMMRKYNVCAGLGVLLFTTFVNTCVDIVPLYILRLVGHVIAACARTDYEVVDEVWEIQPWMYVAVKGITVVLLVCAVCVESYVILKGAGGKSLLYRIVGSIVLVIYAEVICMYVVFFKYSVAAVLFNWWFWPVLVLYLFAGIVVDRHVKSVVRGRKGAKKKKKKQCKK